MLASLLKSIKAAQVPQSMRILQRILARKRCREELFFPILLGLLICKILLQVFAFYLSFNFEPSSFFEFF